MNSLSMNSSQCSCYDNVKNGVAYQECNCCASPSVLNITQPTCNTSISSQQQCKCQNVNGVNNCTCNSKQGGITLTTSGVQIPPNQCQCLNQTVAGNNFNNCQCCVPNPPPTLCQSLAMTNSSILNCKCSYIVVNGVSTFSCNCSAQVNATTTLTRSNMVMDQSKCCCVEKSNPITRMGFQSCNCTQPAVFIPQNCICTPVAGTNNSVANCNCNDCNNAPQHKTVPLG